jgi:hypothetical protein
MAYPGTQHIATMVFPRPFMSGLTEVTGRDQAKHDLMALWRQLRKPDPAGGQHEEQFGLIALAEEQLAVLELFRMGQTTNPYECFGR